MGGRTVYSGRDTAAQIAGATAQDLAALLALQAGLSPGVCRVAFETARFKNNYISAEKLAKSSRVSRSWLFKCLKKLEGVGQLIRQRVAIGETPPGAKFASVCGNVVRTTIGRGYGYAKARALIAARREFLLKRGRLQMPLPRRRRWTAVEVAADIAEARAACAAEFAYDSPG